MQPRLKILIIEDNSDHLFLIEEALEANFTILSSRSIQDAKERLSQNSFDIILSDYRLSDGDGMQVLTYCKKHNISTPVIIMTSQGNEDIAVSAMKIGVADYLVKGNDGFSDLESKINDTWNKHQKLLENEKYKSQIEQANQELRKLNQEKSSVLGIVSHDLKNYLSYISSASEIILMHEKSGNSNDHLKYIRGIKRNSTKAINLIHDILDLGRMESGGSKLSKTEFRFRDLIEDVLESLSFITQEKKATLSVNSEDIFYVFADYGRLFQLYSNLISNSLKYSPHNSKIKINIKNTEKEVLEISVSDTGRGIEKSNLSEIFNSYHQVKKEDSLVGSGLGLSIAKKICELHKGTIWAESAGENKGTTFITRLPIKIDFVDTSEKKISRNTYSAIEKVLLTDDSEDIRLLTGEDLETLGYKVETALNGKDALDKIPVFQPDLLMLDLRMPVMDGLQVLKTLRNNPSTQDLPVIVMTNEATASMMDEINQYASSFITKPASIEELQNKIKYVASQKAGVLNTNKKENLDELVLVAEGDELERLKILAILSDAGIKCIGTKNGYEALFFSRKKKFSKFIINPNLPLLSGKAFLEKLYQGQHLSTPTLFLHEKIENLLKQQNTAQFTFLGSSWSAEELLSSLSNLVAPSQNITQNSEEQSFKVLVIDDAEDLHFIIKKMFERHPLTLHSALTGKEGIHLFKQQPYSLVLIDANLPDSNGKEVTQSLKKLFSKNHFPKPRLIAFSANEEDTRELLDAGCDGSLDKNLDVHTFCKEIFALIESE